MSTAGFAGESFDFIPQAVLYFASGVLGKVNGRIVLPGDGVKNPKSGKKMPGVKKLHQESESNTKPEYIFGHSLHGVKEKISICANPSEWGVSQALRNTLPDFLEFSDVACSWVKFLLLHKQRDKDKSKAA